MNGETIKILLIEDNPGDVHLLQHILAGGGGTQFKLWHVDRLSTGLERLTKGGIDIVLLDLSLPDGQGLDTFLRVHAQAPEVPIVVLSGLDDEILSIKAVQEGAQDYLVKGYANGPTLIRAIRYAIERQRTEEELRAMSGALENAVEGIVRLDTQMCYIAANRAYADMLGCAPEALIGIAWPSTQHPEDREKVMLAYQTMLAQGKAEVEARGLRQDGSAFYNHLVLIKGYDKTKHFTGHYCFMKDITKRKALESQLAQAQKLESIGQLAAGIAHEINTPIQYVGDNARFLKDSFESLAELFGYYVRLIAAAKRGPVPPDLLARIEAALQGVDFEYLREEIPKAIQASLEGVGRVAKIVRAMKEFSHPDVEEKVAVDINRAIESTITVCRNEWKYVADLVTNFDTHLSPVYCLPGEFNQVILNLIVNAAHAIGDAIGDGSRGKGTITVSTRGDGSWVEIRITDTGVGIPPAIRSKIFDPFFTTKEVGRGTGQGLALAHSVVVALHGGTISFDTAMGMGTTFVIRLPIDNAR